MCVICGVSSTLGTSGLCSGHPFVAYKNQLRESLKMAETQSHGPHEVNENVSKRWRHLIDKSYHLRNLFAHEMITWWYLLVGPDLSLAQLDNLRSSVGQSSKIFWTKTNFFKLKRTFGSCSVDSSRWKLKWLLNWALNIEDVPWSRKGKSLLLLG